jgi:hypothetical protein
MLQLKTFNSFTNPIQFRDAKGSSSPVMNTHVGIVFLNSRCHRKTDNTEFFNAESIVLKHAPKDTVKLGDSWVTQKATACNRQDDSNKKLQFFSDTFSPTLFPF